MTEMLILFHASPVFIYAASAWIFWRLLRVPWRFQLWRQAWGCMLAATVGFSFVRTFNVIDALIADSTDALLPYQTLLVLLSASCLCVGSWLFLKILRAGKML